MKKFKNMTKAELIKCAQIYVCIVMDCERLISEMVMILTNYDQEKGLLGSKKDAFMILSSDDMELIKAVMEDYNNEKLRHSHES